MANWVRVKYEEIKEKYEFEPHCPQKTSYCSWMVCKKCGLIYLRNALTQWCVSKGCNSELHPEYKSKIKEFTHK